ncbi:MAG TPA: hypothetical protein VLQ93_22895 [Myxococcaceae bacterium]|nr:hypothetical protein [Myxococcaceae bacterium]
MKLLTLQDLNVEDSLRLTFKGSLDRQTSVEQELEPFLQALEAYAADWMPDIVKGKRRRKYSRPAVWKALEEKRDGCGSLIGLYRTTSPAVALTVDLWRERDVPSLSISLNVQPLTFFAEEEQCGRFVELVRAWAARYPVSYASAHSTADRELADFPSFGRDKETWRRDGFDKVYEVCWLNVFGRKLVEKVGRERMLSAPAWRVEELPDGAVLLVTRPTAADFASEEAREVQARVQAHLRPELDLSTVLGTLRERSAALAPVEPRFHPDVAPLLLRTVECLPLSERQRRIAELNDWRPAEPVEWLPVEAALPSDVEEEQRELEHYGWLAEHLVALLHTEVPSVFEESPESLTEVDFYFWRWEFPERRQREAIEEHLVPAVGAYLGEVLVRNLGGRWIPRRKLEETQVVVGSRAWLPFVRARSYLRSCQALLDFSLTQLYREAERHRAA